MTRMIDVLLGLVFVFTVFSLFASIAVEVLEAVLRKRAADLEKGISKLLGNPEQVKKFYAHPLIQALEVNPGKHPSYIPSQAFATALLDVVANVRSATTDVAATLAQLPAEDRNPVAGAIRALAAHADGTLDGWRRGIEGWFDATMDRVSAIYKRRTQVFLLVIGLLVGGLLNVDTINIAQTLASDPEIRGRVVEAAEELGRSQALEGGTEGTKETAKPQKPPPSAPTGRLGLAEGSALPKTTKDIGSAGALQLNPPAPPSVPAKRPPPLPSLDRLQAFGLPIGWVAHPTANDPRAFPRDLWGIVKKVAGILMTAFAITLGAPFWFDVLNRVTQLRASVKPTARRDPDTTGSPS